jgi:hypothetical protein
MEPIAYKECVSAEHTSRIVKVGGHVCDRVGRDANRTFCVDCYGAYALQCIDAGQPVRCFACPRTVNPDDPNRWQEVAPRLASALGAAAMEAWRAREWRRAQGSRGRPTRACAEGHLVLSAAPLGAPCGHEEAGGARCAAALVDGWQDFRVQGDDPARNQCPLCLCPYVRDEHECTWYCDTACTFFCCEECAAGFCTNCPELRGPGSRHKCKGWPEEPAPAGAPDAAAPAAAPAGVPPPTPAGKKGGRKRTREDGASGSGSGTTGGGVAATPAAGSQADKTPANKKGGAGADDSAGAGPPADAPPPAAPPPATQQAAQSAFAERVKAAVAAAAAAVVAAELAAEDAAIQAERVRCVAAREGLERDEAALARRAAELEEHRAAAVGGGGGAQGGSALAGRIRAAAAAVLAQEGGEVEAERARCREARAGVELDEAALRERAAAREAFRQ